MVFPRSVGRRFIQCALAFAAVFAAGFACAQTYPDRPIRLIVPAAAGGPTDVLARFVGDSLTRSLGQPAIVDNRAGAGGAIGARVVATSAPDGYTLLFGNTAVFATIPATSKTAGYDPRESFVPVAKVIDSYQVVVVRPTLPVRSVAELVAYAKANPGKLNLAAAGVGNITHLSGELLKSRAGIDFATVQYKSGAEMLNAILGGEVDFAIDNIGSVQALVRAGKLRAIAVTSPARKPEFPELPTMAEAGIADYVVTSFFGVVAPARTARAIVAKLNAAINDGLKQPAFQASLRALGAQSSPETPESFRTLIDQEAHKWSDLARAANIDITN
jgi:tripartite-type tricarboxylate transporter receptor subunit TctC